MNDSASASPSASVPAASAAAASAQAASFFPVFLRLTGRRVLVVGGGPVATSKLQALLDAGAQITVVAPEVTAEIDAASASRLVTIHRRPFAESDLDGVWFVVAAATPDVNRAVAQAAEARAVFVNAVDDPPNATAYLGGVVRRDGVTVAISTDGRAPALAGLLREALDSLLPRDLDRWMQASRAIRQEWIADRVPMEERRPLLLRRLNELYAQRAAEQQAAAQQTAAQRAVAPHAAARADAAQGKDVSEPALAGAGRGEQER